VYRTRTRSRAAATVAALSLVLAACGQDDDPTIEAPTDEQPADDPAVEEDAAGEEDAAAEDEGEHNEADVEFVQGMIPHHEGAIEMAELVEGRTERQELIDLADEIIEVQDAEIEQLRGMLERMGAGEMAMDDDMGDMDHGDMGMMDEAEMEELRELEGDEFDRRFMEAMIVHHEGAIDMAERVLAEGQDAEVAGLAEAVIAAQEAEIEQMQQWLEEWDLA
jgi:uncharacterized protein (DUF305 family)